MKKASQLIYTACGKERNGFFATWAKSDDITPNEEREINDLMSYKVPRNSDLPYEPTIEEADTLFPKKYSFTKLSTGRYCIAMSTYIGNVYSDLDARVGNYITHAFVLDDLDGFNPLNVILNPQFKRLLTYKEWHDDPIPSSLPKVDITDGNEITSSEIKTVLNTNNVQIFKCMLQACLDNEDNNETVVINDSDDKLPLWFKLIGLCVGKNYYKYTYTNMHIVNPMKPVNVKLAEMFKTGNYNYASNIAYGLPVFNFETGNYNDTIKVSKYVDTLTEFLLNGDVAGAKAFISNIAKLIEKYGFAHDDAIDITMLFGGKLDRFTTPQALMSVVGLLEGKDYDVQLVTSNIAKVLNNYSKDTSILPVYRYLYKNSNNYKSLIISEFMNNLSAFGVDKSSHTSFVKSIFNNAPFTMEDYYQYIIKNQEVNSLANKGKEDFAYEYLLLSLCCNNISNQFSKGVYNIDSVDSQTIDAFIRYHVVQKDNSKLTTLAELLNSTDKRLYPQFLSRTIQNIEKTDSLVKHGLNYAFSMYQKLKLDISLQYYVKAYEKTTKEEYLKAFQAAYQSNPQYYDELEAKFETTPEMKSFIEYKEYVELIQDDKVTLSSLDKIYNKYYSNPADTKNVFFSKIQIYLAGIPKDKRINVTSDLYSKYFKNHELSYKDCKKILKYFYDLIFDLDYKEIFAQLKNNSEYLTNLVDRLGLNDDPSFAVIRKVSIYESCAKSRDISKIIDSILEAPQFASLNNKGRAFIVNNYMDVVIYVTSLCLKNDNFGKVFANVFAEITKESNFIRLTAGAIKKLEDKDEIRFKRLYFLYIIYATKSKSSNHIDVCKNVLAELGKNKAEKILIEYVNKLDETPNFDKSLYDPFINFVKEYEDENYKGFAKLFKKGILSKTDKYKEQQKNDKKAKEEEKKRLKEEEAERKRKEKEAKEEKKRKDKEDKDKDKKDKDED